MTEPQLAHIAMFSIAAPGHVNPSIEVIRELVATRLRSTSAMIVLVWIALNIS